jgi:hypothetical protein
MKNHDFVIITGDKIPSPPENRFWLGKVRFEMCIKCNLLKAFMPPSDEEFFLSPDHESFYFSYADYYGCECAFRSCGEELAKQVML